MLSRGGELKKPNKRVVRLRWGTQETIMKRKVAATIGTHSPDSVGWWRMKDYPRSVLFDSSECGNHGHISGAIWNKDGGRQCLKFNGTSDYVNCGSDASLDLTALTVACWMKADTAPGVNYPFWVERGAFENGWGLLKIAGSWPNPGLRWYDGASVRDVTASGISEGTWYHVAATHDGTTARIYVNAVEKDSLVAAFNPATGKQLRIGGHPSAPTSYPYHGLLDDVRIYNRALSVAEIERLYDKTR